MACAVRFYLAFQITTFMKGIPTKMIHTSHAIAVQTHAQLRAKFRRLVQFAPHDWSHIRLADAHNPAITTAAFVPVHLNGLLHGIQSRQNCTSIVIETHHDSTFRLYQSTTAAR
jgi:hypothetical protein